MHRHVAYCSACDRDVQLVVTDEATHDGQANLHDAELVCLEIGDRCSGGLCPLSAAPASVMATRLVANHLQTELQPTMSAACDRCGVLTQHVMIDHSWMTCVECGATIPRR